MASNSPTPNPQITFSDYLSDPKQRELVENSVAAHVALLAESVARARSAEAERAKLVAVLQAPFTKQITDDPEATKALDELRTRKLIELDATNALRQNEQPLTDPIDADPVPVPLPREVTMINRTPPYDYTWSFHDSAGHPPHNQFLDLNTGQGGIDARSGSLEGGASGFVYAEAGFGLVFTTHRRVSARCAPFSFMGHTFAVRAAGVGANATSEGGFLLTAWEDFPNRKVGDIKVKLWRSRVSTSAFDPDEEAHGHTPPVLVGTPASPQGQGLTFSMNPGHTYTFNIGMWVFTDRSFGVGAGAAQSLIQGTVRSITSWLTPV